MEQQSAQEEWEAVEDIQSGTGPRSVWDGGTAHRGSGEGHGWGGGGELGKGQKGWEEEWAAGSLHSPPS